MLRPFLFKEHPIQQIEQFMRYLLFEVMFEAPKHQGAKLKDIISKDYKNFFKFHLKKKRLAFTVISEKLYAEFQKLSDVQIEMLKKAYHTNNQVEKICGSEIVPVRFSDLQPAFSSKDGKIFLNDLKEFCELQYTSCLDLVDFEKTFGSLDKYYKSLVGDDDVCHCCGIGPVLTENNSPRDAFDHYLSKKKYPFVSVNFKNLLPICHACNSSYKNQKDTLYYINNGIEVRRKVFFPYYEGEVPYRINIKVHLACCYQMDGISKDKIEFAYECPGYEEEVESWRALYGIDERYRSYCMSKQIKTKMKELYFRYLKDKRFVLQYLSFSEALSGVDANFLAVPFIKAAFESLPRI